MVEVKRVELLPKAKFDLREAATWYEGQRRGLGSEFLGAVNAVTTGLSRFVHRHPLHARRTRRATLRRFPYMVLYVVEGDVVLVLAVLHEHRSPHSWVDRVQEAPRAVASGVLLAAN